MELSVKPLCSNEKQWDDSEFFFREQLEFSKGMFSVNFQLLLIFLHDMYAQRGYVLKFAKTQGNGYSDKQ